ncbi:IKI3 family-domain-containing protein [Coemansia spiralis]|nr:IKI3 family-domain-containing protein [Coemansia spiralis]
MERELVFIALVSGDIYTVQGDKVELVGTVDPGIMACAWSPDDELLAVVTGEHKLLLMTQNFDVLEEFPVLRDQPQEENMVSVGWGKSETQYQGSSTHIEAVSREKEDAFDSDDQYTRISWRGDGAYFAVSVALPRGRELRVFSRDGKLHSVGEKIKALGHALCWRPSGRLILSTENKGHRHDVVFFERNGLRHGEFTLRQETKQVFELVFNADSSVLAVVARAHGEMCVELWTDKNYHWYLKQEIRLAAFGGSNMAHVVWDTEDPMCLHLLTASTFCTVRLHATPSVARVASDESNAAACVVDGSMILYTPFSYANVPPPMALNIVDAGEPVVHLAFATFGTGNDFVALLADRQSVVLYRCEYAVAICDSKPPRELARIRLPTSSVLRQIVWTSPSVLVCLGWEQNGDRHSSDLLQTITVVELSDAEPPVVIGSHRYLVSALIGCSEIVSVWAAPHANGKILLQDASGQVLAFESGAATVATKFPTMCVEIDAVSVGGELIVVGRSSRNQLFANGHLVSSACSSFYLRKDVLVFTTTTHYVRFVPVDNSNLTTVFIDDQEAEPAQKAKYDESCRRIERGSAIVLASPVDDRVVFQMPRGNLETVRPRALVLASVRRALESRRYLNALRTCRINRIDMNLVFDHIANVLIGDFAEFVRQVDDPDLLNLFVSGLRDEDVTQTMYTGLTKHTTPLREGVVEQKTTRICHTLRQVLTDTGDKKYMPTILTTFMCEQPADIASALQLLAPMSVDERDAALTYLLFLSDVDTVYNAALGLYDLPLALLVAQRSQRDPREYLAALGELNAIDDEEYRRYKIDAQLGRPRLALEHLCSAYKGSREALWPEIIEYVESNELYQDALLLFNGHKKRHPDVCVLYGDYLAQMHKWEQAAGAYLLGNATAQAVDAFVRAKEWRTAMALATAPEKGFSAQMVYGTAIKASKTLADHHLFLDAATVLLEYTEEHEDVVALLVKGKHWAEALRCARSHGRVDLIETTVAPGLNSAHAEVNEDIDEVFGSFEAKFARLKELRAKPLEAIINRNVLNGEQDASLDNIDVMSDTMSMASQFSTFTATVSNASSRMTGSTARRLSKSKRKEERKRVRGKKGSIYEESYLVDSLSKLVDRVRVNQQIVHEMNLVFIHFGNVSAAHMLQKKFSRLVELVLMHATVIFDEQRAQMQLGENGVPEPMDASEFGLSSQPRHPKPGLPSYSWKIDALV